MIESFELSHDNVTDSKIYWDYYYFYLMIIHAFCENEKLMGAIIKRDP